MLGLWRARQSLARVINRIRRLHAARAASKVRLYPKRRAHGLPGELIVSLTSYEARYGSLAKTLRSLINQTVAWDRLVLWVAEGDEANLPEDVSALGRFGLEIRTCRDLRSYKKLIPALEQWPDGYIVTADDDLYYPPNWLKALVDEFDRTAPAIIVWRAHMAEVESDGRLAPYGDWSAETSLRGDLDRSQILFPTGGAGALYPPHALAPEVSDVETFTRLCPIADDVWLFWMARKQGTRHRRVKGRFEIIAWEGSQEVGLYHENVVEKHNDVQIRAMESELGMVPQYFDRPTHTSTCRAF